MNFFGLSEDRQKVVTWFTMWNPSKERTRHTAQAANQFPPIKDRSRASRWHLCSEHPPAVEYDEQSRRELDLKPIQPGGAGKVGARAWRACC